MAVFMCKKCGSTEYYLQEKGFQIGIYCSSCGSWQKWVGKKNLNEYKMGGHRIHGAHEVIELIKNAPLGVESLGVEDTMSDDVPFGDCSLESNSNTKSQDNHGITGEKSIKITDAMIEAEVERRLQERMNKMETEVKSSIESHSDNDNSTYCPLCEGEPMIPDGNSRVEITVFGGVLTVTDPNGETIYGIYKLKRCPYCGKLF